MIGTFFLTLASVGHSQDLGRSQFYLQAGVENYSGDILEDGQGSYFALGLRTSAHPSDRLLSFLSHVFLEYSAADSAVTGPSSEKKSQSISDIGFDMGLCIRKFVGFCPFIGLAAKSVSGSDSEVYFRPIRYGMELEIPVSKLNILVSAVQTSFGQKIAGETISSHSSIFSAGISFDFSE
jgi:hypothetical protein